MQDYRLFAAVLFLVVMPSAGSAADVAPTATPASAPTASARATALAPADTYFGRFGMSPLSIRSTIGFLGRQYHYRTIADRDLLRKALITEDALREWRTRYPADPWLPATFFHLEQLYQAVQTDEAHKHATALLKDVVRAYPNTKEGRLSRERLAAGFPPLVPETPLVSTPAPVASPSMPSADASASPQPRASGAPSAGTPSAATTPSPAPSPAPSPSPKQNAREV